MKVGHIWRAAKDSGGGHQAWLRLNLYMTIYWPLTGRQAYNGIFNENVIRLL